MKDLRHVRAEQVSARKGWRVEDQLQQPDRVGALAGGGQTDANVKGGL